MNDARSTDTTPPKERTRFLAVAAASLAVGVAFEIALAALGGIVLGGPSGHAYFVGLTFVKTIVAMLAPPVAGALVPSLADGNWFAQFGTLLVWSFAIAVGCGCFVVFERLRSRGTNEAG